MIRDPVTRDAHRLGDEPDALHFRNHQDQGLGGAGAGQDDVVEDRSSLPQIRGLALGERSSTCWELVAACTVVMDADKNAVSAEIIQERLHHVGQAGGRAGGVGNQHVPLGIVVGVVDPHDGGDGIRRHFLALVLDLEGSRHDDLLGPGSRCPRREPLGIVGRTCWVEKGAGGIHHQFHPVIAPADFGTGLRCLRRKVVFTPLMRMLPTLSSSSSITRPARQPYR